MSLGQPELWVFLDRVSPGQADLMVFLDKVSQGQPALVFPGPPHPVALELVSLASTTPWSSVPELVLTNCWSRPLPKEALQGQRLWLRSWWARIPLALHPARSLAS